MKHLLYLNNFHFCFLPQCPTIESKLLSRAPTESRGCPTLVKQTRGTSLLTNDFTNDFSSKSK